MTSTSSTAEVRLLQRFVRRWRLVLVGLVATIGLCAAAMALVPANYTAQANILLTPPPTTGPNGSPNPYLSLNGLQPVADILGRALTSDATLTKLRSAGLTGTYLVVPDPTSNGPILDVSVTAETASAALRDLGLVVGEAEPQMNSLQAAESIAGRDRVHAQIVAGSTKATPSRKSQIRALVVAAVAGLAGTALAVTAVDVVLMRRRPRRIADLDATPADSPAHHNGAAQEPSPVMAGGPQARVNGAEPALSVPDVAAPPMVPDPPVRPTISRHERILRALSRMRMTVRPDSARVIAAEQVAPDEQVELDTGTGGRQQTLDGPLGASEPTPSAVDPAASEGHPRPVEASRPSARPAPNGTAVAHNAARSTSARQLPTQTIVPPTWRRIPARSNGRSRVRATSVEGQSDMDAAPVAAEPSGTVGRGTP